MYCDSTIRMSELKSLKNSHEFLFVVSLICEKRKLLVSVKLSKFNNSSPDLNFAIHRRITSCLLTFH